MQPTFIGHGMVSTRICEELVSYYNTHSELHQKGTVGDTAPDSVRSQYKDCTQIAIEWQEPVLNKYMQELKLVIDQYIVDYKWATFGSPWTARETVNLKHYAPGQAFHAWHCERCSSDPVYASRHLVFMTYLNTVEDQGETEWYYQNVKTKPVKGLTVVWPSSWTHMHRGIASPSEHKYILSGWLSYVS